MAGPGLYPRLLGASWYELDEAVRRAHAEGAVVRAAGLLRVRHGPGGLTGLLLRLAGLPAPNEATAARLEVRRRGPVERWCRMFGKTWLVSLQRGGVDGLLREQFGILEVRFRLVAIDGALEYRQVGAAIRLGRFGLPLPPWAVVRVAAREAAAGEPDRTRLAVAVRAPWGGLLLAYDGSIRWDGGGSGSA